MILVVFITSMAYLESCLGYHQYLLFYLQARIVTVQTFIKCFLSAPPWREHMP